MELDKSIVEGVNKANKKLGEFFYLLANEPSVGLYHVQEHIRKTIPKNSELKRDIRKKYQHLEALTYDVNFSLQTVRSLHDLATFTSIKSTMDRCTDLLASMNKGQPMRRAGPATPSRPPPNLLSSSSSSSSSLSLSSSSSSSSYTSFSSFAHAPIAPVIPSLSTSTSSSSFGNPVFNSPAPHAPLATIAKQDAEMPSEASIVTEKHDEKDNPTSVPSTSAATVPPPSPSPLSATSSSSSFSSLNNNTLNNTNTIAGGDGGDAVDESDAKDNSEETSERVDEGSLSEQADPSMDSNDVVVTPRKLKKQKKPKAAKSLSKNFDLTPKQF